MSANIQGNDRCHPNACYSLRSQGLCEVFNSIFTETRKIIAQKKDKVIYLVKDAEIVGRH